MRLTIIIIWILETTIWKNKPRNVLSNIDLHKTFKITRLYMLYQKKIYKLVFLFLFLFYSLFIYDCYGTEEQSKCTCEIDGKSLCPRCLDDFSLYFSNRNIDQVDALDVASKPIQHKSANIEACENCEENLIKFYFMGKKTLCPRCTLEYLSFHFSSQEIDTLKLSNTNL